MTDPVPARPSTPEATEPVDDISDLWWDTAAPLPTLATTASNPWDFDSVTPTTGGIGLAGIGGLTIGGLMWLGARIYDPVSRGFLSTDPLSAVPGTTWAANPYAYAGNNPLALADPTGLRPATDQDPKNWAGAHQSHWQEALSDALQVAALASALIPGLDLVAPEALELGAEALDATTVATDALEAAETARGALTSVAKTASSAAAKMGRALDNTAAAITRPLKPIAKAAAPTGTKMGIHAAVGGASSAGTYVVAQVGHENGKELIAATVTGATTAAATTTFIDPAAEAISGKLSNSGFEWVRIHSSILSKPSRGAMGFAVSGSGSVMQSNLADTDTDPVNVISTAASGAGSPYVPTKRLRRVLNLPTDGTSEQWAAAAIDSGLDVTSEILRKLLGLR